MIQLVKYLGGQQDILVLHLAHDMQHEDDELAFDYLLRVAAQVRDLAEEGGVQDAAQSAL